MLTRFMFEAIREAERDDFLRERIGSMIVRYRQAVTDVVRADQQHGVISAAVSAKGIATLAAPAPA